MADEDRLPHGSSEPEAEPEDEDTLVTESAPLLSGQQDDGVAHANAQDQSQTTRRSWFPWLRKEKARINVEGSRGRWRWSSIVAIIVLVVMVVLLMVLGFIVPPAVKAYTEQSAVIEPTDLTIEAITATGLKARVQGNLRLEAARVKDDHTRRIGRFMAFIFRKVDAEETPVQVFLPDYDNALVGSAVVPPQFGVSIVNGHNNFMDFVADVTPGKTDYLRMIANDWMKGKLTQLKVTGKATLTLKTGPFSLGSHDLVDSAVLEAKEIPSVPEYKLNCLNFHDIPGDDAGGRALGANISVSVYNEYPLSVGIPPLGFEVLVSNCLASEPYIVVAEAFTDEINIKSHANVTANARGVMREIPESLTRACPDTNMSPLDVFMDSYLHGQQTRVFLRGKKLSGSDTPEWIGDLLESISVPFELPGSSFGSLIRNFTLADVDFKLPSPFADPSDPDSQPRVSGAIQVLADIPQELKLDFGVNSIKADADLLYKKEKLGELNLRHWQEANSTRLFGIGTDQDMLNITSRVVDVPLNITNGSVFAEVMQNILFGKPIMLDVKSTVDAKLSTVLGTLVVKDIPAEGKVPVNALPGNAVSSLRPRISELRVLSTSTKALHLQGMVDFMNPTPYTASVPFLSIQIESGGHQIGEAIGRNLDLKPGNNTRNVVSATWNPFDFGGGEALECGRQLLSDYLSGKNATLTLRPHERSIPTMPELGKALSKLSVTIPAPRFRLPGDEEGEESLSFIRESTFHIVSSTATFLLASPLQHDTIYLEAIDAVAYYNHTEPVGRIVNDDPFEVPPGLTQTPRLPVVWSPGNVGYEEMRNALGGSLKLDAVANVTLRLGNWIEQARYEGRGIGAKVRL